MVDFNRFRTYGTPNELEIRAARLRSEVDTNRFWYDLVTLALPQFGSRQDAERVCWFINRRMTRTRRMELELRWLDTLLRKPPADQPFVSDEAMATLRTVVPPLASTNYDFGPNAVLFAVSSAIFSAREAIGGSIPGAIVLILALMGLCLSGVFLFFAALLWAHECIEARSDMQAIRSMSEQELLHWFRGTRLRQLRAAAERAPLAALRK